MICAFLVHVLGVFNREKAFVIIIRLLRENSLTKLLVKRRGAGLEEQPGAPNENIVLNHLNIALLNVF